MNQPKKEQFIKQIQKLKDRVELPSLYLGNYFIDLKNDIHQEIVSYQQNLQNDNPKIKELNQIWEKMSAKIDSFEKQCINKKHNLEEYKVRLKAIEVILNKGETINLEIIRDVIEDEEFRLNKYLFQNKTIAFINVDFVEESKRELINRKLLIVNDEFISQKTFKKR